MVFIYGGKIINKYLTVEAIANNDDKKRGIMNILVFEEGNNSRNECLNNINFNNINNLSSIVTKMSVEIKEIEKYINLIKILQDKVEKIKKELDELKIKVYNNFNLKEHFFKLNAFNNLLVGKKHSTKFFKGMIMAWYGLPSDIPKDWAICDGTKGTPDLRNRFIMGASQDNVFNSSGGNSSIIISKTNLPKLGTGSFSADSHRGKFHHSNNGIIKYNGWYKTFIKNSNNGDDWGSDWTIDLNEGMNSTPINIINPYFALFYIMKL